MTTELASADVDHELRKVSPVHSGPAGPEVLEQEAADV
eukprot:CAMPEP_0195066422 /NCGR_PEP_ID=MMETSP0448-20130528/11779_1 /TAXON_ID=66468 /ORGANISM="Heterocapsa triquestra, Strain CCMP 448" /LENGTH=37 /DNA_ID= /DNA_START= /DNA_END= /DNA_ORIENTATION=